MQRLIERGAERARLAAAVARACAGSGGLTLVTGPPGIGKTSLVEAACTRAREAGMLVLTGRGGELEHDQPYGVVRQLFERLLMDATAAERRALLARPDRHVAPLLPEIDDGRSVVESAHGLYWLTVSLAARGPLLLAVDDAHWADSASLRFLLHLARRIEGLPVMIVVAHRLGETGADEALLRRLAAEQSADLIEPTPLTRRGVSRLLASRLGVTSPTTVVEACHDVTGGNPFFVTELAAALRAEEIDAAGLRVLAPQAVSRSILMRLGGLSDTARSLAEALAVLGEGTEPAHAAALAGLDPARALEALAELSTAWIVADTTERSEFLHPLIRTALLRDLPAARRALLHQRAASLLADAGAPVESVAAHVDGAVPGAVDRAVETLRSAAGRALERGAPDAAARWLRRALLEPLDERTRGAVLAALASAELRCGELAGAAAHGREALALSGGSLERTERAVVLARALAAGGEVADAVAVLEAQIADAREADRELWLLLEAELVPLHHLASQPAARSRERGTQLTGATRAQRRMLAAQALESVFDAQGSAAEAAGRARDAWAGGALLRDLDADDALVTLPPYVLAIAEELDEANAQAGAILDQARERGWALAFGSASGVRAQIELHRGELRDAEAHARAAVGAADGSSPLHRLVRARASRWLAEALIARGSLDEAEGLVEVSETDSPAVRRHALLARGLVHRARGSTEQALADLRLVGELSGTLQIDDPALPWRALAALALAGLGRSDEAVALAERELARARAWGAASAVGAALRARALVDPGDAQIDGLEQAVAALQGSPARLAHAGALVDLGVALRRGRQRRAAVDRLREGVDLAAQCGASALLERAREELRVLGARPRRLMFSGPESLTATERRVAEQAAGGRSNRQIAQDLFVTLKTVESHLASVYRKLDIRSRRELGEALPRTTRAQPVGGSERVTLEIVDTETDPGASRGIDAVGGAFEREHANVVVERTMLNFEELRRRVGQLATSERPPSIVQGNQGTTDMALVRAGAIRSLEPYAKAYGWETTFSPGQLATVRVADNGSSIGSGTLYGIAPRAEIVGVFYNKRIARGLGIGAPPETFAEFEASLGRAKAKGVTAIGQGLSDYNMLPGLLLDHFAEPEDVRAWVFGEPQASVDTPEGREALGTIADWGRRGYLYEDAIPTSDDEAAARFADGRALYYLSGPWRNGSLVEALGGDVGFFAIPPAHAGGQVRATGALSTSYHITSACPVPEVAGAYLGFLTSWEGQALLLEHGDVPATSVDMSGAKGSQLDILEALEQVGEDDGLNPYRDWAAPGMSEALMDVTQGLISDRIDPAEGSRRLQDVRDSALS